MRDYPLCIRAHKSGGILLYARHLLQKSPRSNSYKLSRKLHRVGLGEAPCRWRGVALQGGLRGIPDEFFHDNAVTPHAIDFAMTTIHPDHLEAYTLMQRQTGRVLRADLGTRVSRTPDLYSSDRGVRGPYLLPLCRAHCARPTRSAPQGPHSRAGFGIDPYWPRDTSTTPLGGCLRDPSTWGHIRMRAHSE